MNAANPLGNWLDRNRARFATDQAAAEYLEITGGRLSQILSGAKPSRELAIRIHVMTLGEVPGSVTRSDIWSRPEHVPLPEAAE